MALQEIKAILGKAAHRDHLGQTGCPACLARKVRLERMAWPGQRGTPAQTGRLVLKALRERTARKAFPAKAARQERMEFPDHKENKGRRVSKEKPAPLARMVTTSFPFSQKRLR